MKKGFVNGGIRAAIRFVASVALFSGAALMPVLPVSCKSSDDDELKIEGETTGSASEDGRITSPKVVACSAVSASAVQVSFSRKVSVEGITFTDADGSVFSITDDSVSFDDSGLCARIALPVSTDVGSSYKLSMTVFDADGNSQSYEQEFYGYNAMPARLILSEVRTEYSKDKYCEFVELFALRGGNICGLTLDTATIDGKDSLFPFVFPSVNVSAGDYITVHMRNSGNDAGAVSEISDKTAAKAKDSSPTAWDFWVSGDEKLVGRNDVVLLEDSDSNILDGIIMAQSSRKEWSAKQKEICERLFSSGIWKSGIEISDVIHTDKTAQNSTVSRQNIAELSGLYLGKDDIPDLIPTKTDDWIVTKSEGKKNPGATPGLPNSSVKAGD